MITTDFNANFRVWIFNTRPLHIHVPPNGIIITNIVCYNFHQCNHFHFAINYDVIIITNLLIIAINLYHYYYCFSSLQLLFYMFGSFYWIRLRANVFFKFPLLRYLNVFYLFVHIIFVIRKIWPRFYLPIYLPPFTKTKLTNIHSRL